MILDSLTVSLAAALDLGDGRRASRWRFNGALSAWPDGPWGRLRNPAPGYVPIAPATLPARTRAQVYSALRAALADEVTTEMVEALRDEAGAHGDLSLAKDCTTYIAGTYGCRAAERRVLDALLDGWAARAERDR